MKHLLRLMAIVLVLLPLITTVPSSFDGSASTVQAGAAETASMTFDNTLNAPLASRKVVTNTSGTFLQVFDAGTGSGVNFGGLAWRIAPNQAFYSFDYNPAHFYYFGQRRYHFIGGVFAPSTSRIFLAVDWTYLSTNRHSCSEFESQADAQAALRAAPADVGYLDGDNDGRACEDNSPPFDRTPVAR